MARPARVRMRRRKPLVLARRRLLGWNVRLLTEISLHETTSTDELRGVWGCQGGAGSGAVGRQQRPPQQACQRYGRACTPVKLTPRVFTFAPNPLLSHLT